MSQRGFCFVVVLLLFFNGEIFSQFNPAYLKLPIDYGTIRQTTASHPLHLDWNLDKKGKKKSEASQENMQPLLLSSLFTLNRPLLAPSYYCDQLGFFCKKEWQIEKTTSIPFRFRLGSLDYVNYLEKKPNAIKPLVF